MAKQLEVEMTVRYVQATPEQMPAYNRAMKLLANMTMRLYEQEQKKKMGGAQVEGSPRASSDTSSPMGLPSGSDAPAGSSPSSLGLKGVVQGPPARFRPDIKLAPES